MKRSVDQVRLDTEEDILVKGKFWVEILLFLKECARLMQTLLAS